MWPFTEKSGNPGIVSPHNSFLGDNNGIVTFLVLRLLASGDLLHQ